MNLNVFNNDKIENSNMLNRPSKDGLYLAVITSNIESNYAIVTYIKDKNKFYFEESCINNGRDIEGHWNCTVDAWLYLEDIK